MNFLVEARRLAQKKFNDARAVIAAQAEWPVGSDSQNPDQGFVKGEEFCWSFGQSEYSLFAAFILR